MKHILYIIILTFFSTQLVAQQPFALHITSKDGLPSNEVYNIHQDKKGYIWIATDDGLCKYDGKYFQRYHNAFMSSKAGSFIKEDKKGRIWYGNFDGVLFYVENDSLKNFKSPYLMSIPGEFSVIGDTLILIERNQNLKGFDIHTHKEIYSKKLNYLYNIVYQSENQFQIIHDKGIDFYNSNFKTNYSISNDGKNQYLKALEYNKGYFTYWVDNGKLNVFYIKDGIQQEIFSSKNDAFIQGFYLIDKKLWLLKKDGILLIDIESNKSETLFENESISHICKDNNGYVWISTNFNGIYIINPNLKTKDFSTNSFNFKFFKGGNGIFTYDDVGRIYDISKNMSSPIFSLPVKNQIYKIVEIQHIPNNELLKSARDYAFFKYNQRNYLAISSGTKDIEVIDEKYAAMSISGMFGLVNYHVSEFKSPWDSIFTSNKINENNNWGQPGTSHLFNDVRAKSVAYDNINNQLYYATNIGLFNTTPRNTKEVRFEQNKIFASTLVSFQDHIFCLLNNGDILYIHNQHIDKIKLGADKINIRKIKKINNSLLLIGDQHIFSFDVNSDFDVKKITIKKIYINQPIAELNDIELIEDKYYLSFPNQLYIVDTNQSSEHASLPFYVTGITTNKRKLDNQNQFIFASNENDITIHFSILNYYKTSMVFEYKINDENWKSLESTDRSINLASLSSGSYQIQFKLNNMLMKEDIRFTIKKPWYLQNWFIGLTLLSLISFGYLVYRRRIQVSNKENKVLLEKTKLEKDLRQSLLSSIKSQMNPHFLFNALNTIQSYIITEDKEKASNYLSKFSKLTRKILDMSDKETILLQEEIDALILYVELEKMRFEDLNFTIEFEKDIVANELLIPSMIIQPYVENAIKHGLLHKKGDKQLFIKVRKTSDYLMIQIEDNGIGRKHSEIINRNKSDNHRSFASNANLKRIELLNAEKNEIGVEYADKLCNDGESAGTIVNIKLPIKRIS